MATQANNNVMKLRIVKQDVLEGMGLAVDETGKFWGLELGVGGVISKAYDPATEGDRTEAELLEFWDIETVDYEEAKFAE